MSDPTPDPPKRRPVHASITPERVREAAERSMTTLDNPGLCLECGAEADDCEPDARRYECEHCGAKRVYGAEQLVIMGYGGFLPPGESGPRRVAETQSVCG